MIFFSVEHIFGFASWVQQPPHRFEMASALLNQIIMQRATNRLTIINGLIFIMLEVKLNICDRWKTGDEKQNGDGEPARSGSSQTPSLLVVVGTKHPYTPTLQTRTLSPCPTHLLYTASSSLYRLGTMPHSYTLQY